MAKFCEFTGIEMPEGSESLIKKMCLNCKSFSEEKNENGEITCVCVNKSVMEKGKEKILAAVPEGFEIETLVLKPMILKNPTKKCGVYEPNIDGLVQKITKALV
jgi:hypothetical protein